MKGTGGPRIQARGGRLGWAVGGVEGGGGGGGGGGGELTSEGRRRDGELEIKGCWTLGVRKKTIFN